MCRFSIEQARTALYHILYFLFFPATSPHKERCGIHIFYFFPQQRSHRGRCGIHIFYSKQRNIHLFPPYVSRSRRCVDPSFSFFPATSPAVDVASSIFFIQNKRSSIFSQVRSHRGRSVIHIFFIYRRQTLDGGSS